MPTIDFEPKEVTGQVASVHHDEGSLRVNAKLVDEMGGVETFVSLPTWLVVSAIVGTVLRVRWLDETAFEIEVLEARKGER